MNPRWWRPALEAVRCGLCVHECLIKPGGFGYCGTRGAELPRSTVSADYAVQPPLSSEAGTALGPRRIGKRADARSAVSRSETTEPPALVSPRLGRFCSVAVDPIEKKPLRHWRPGSRILSLGSLGCNMRCPFCQNHDISQPKRPLPLTAVAPEDLAARVRELGLDSVAYTYNEPTLQAEYILEAAPILKEAGAATVLVTNGLFAPAPLADLAPWIAAANVDLKCFNPDTYARLGGSLEAVQRTIARLFAAGTHVELTTLVVPGLSDDPAEFAAEVEWIAALSPEIPLHLSRYFPAHEYAAPPTDLDLLRRFRDAAKARLKHVHLGNVV